MGAKKKTVSALGCWVRWLKSRHFILLFSTAAQYRPFLGGHRAASGPGAGGERSPELTPSPGRASNAPTTPLSPAVPVQGPGTGSDVRINLLQQNFVGSSK